MPDLFGSQNNEGTVELDNNSDNLSDTSNEFIRQRQRVSIDEPVERKIDWRTEEYWKLPENVRKAIDTANMKSKHSQFYDKLQSLNDKIYVFKDVFYTRIPTYQANYLEKKRIALEQKVKNEKRKFKRDMDEMRETMRAQDRRMNSKILSND